MTRFSRAVRALDAIQPPINIDQLPAAARGLLAVNLPALSGPALAMYCWDRPSVLSAAIERERAARRRVEQLQADCLELARLDAREPWVSGGAA